MRNRTAAIKVFADRDFLAAGEADVSDWYGITRRIKKQGGESPLTKFVFQAIRRHGVLGGNRFIDKVVRRFADKTIVGAIAVYRFVGDKIVEFIDLYDDVGLAQELKLSYVRDEAGDLKVSGGVKALWVREEAAVASKRVRRTSRR